jgi:branched-chain amino acid transport system substrate-binding protein
MSARARLLAPLIALALLGAACGSALTDAEVLRANGVEATTSGSELDGTPVTGTDPAIGVTGTTLATETAPGGAGSSGGARPSTSPTTPGVVGTPGESGPIVLGSVGNYSGPAGAAQVGFPRAVQVWAAAMNAKGGLFGRQVKVIVQDDGGDPARYAAAVQDLVENRGVIAFVGQAAVLSVRGGLRYLAEKGIPVIGTDCSAPEWYEPSPTLFPQCADSFGQSVTYMSAGVRLTGKTRLGYVFCGESPACTSNAPLYENESDRAGAQTVYRAQISIAQVDFTANCQAAQQAKVDMMFVLADPGTLARVVRSCDRQGFKPQFVAISISALPDSVKLPGLSRMVLGTPTFPFAGASTPAIDEFHRAMAAYSNGTPGPAESAGWVAAKLFELAAGRAAAASGSLNPTSLIAAMRTVKGESLGGLTVPLDFTNPKPKNQNCAFVMQGDGKGGWTAPLGPGMVCVPGT